MSVFPKGETNCWRTVIRSPSFSFRTLKVGDGDGVSILGRFNAGSLLVFFATELNPLFSLSTPLRRLGFALIFDKGNWDRVGESKLARISFKDAAVAVNKGLLFENCK